MESTPDIQHPTAESFSDGVDVSGLVRHRLLARLADADCFRVGRVVAPAGSGKSRLLAHVALAFPGPVAWCGSPSPVPRSERAFTEWLWDGLAPVLSKSGHPGNVRELVDAIGLSGPSVLVVIDDVHLLEGSDAEPALNDLIGRLPGRLRILMASRVDLSLDLSRLRVSGQLTEIGPDDLRFRTWEVEELFRDVYRDPLIPEDVASLTRRTVGWAAYLQLFHLATARKPQAERRRVLTNLGERTRLVQEYLTRDVLAGLSTDLQDFLLRTGVLRRPTGALCDELLGWSGGSRELLVELERLQLLTERVDEDSYRYHTVLLSYLEARLVETLGAPGARDEHRRAATLLEREGMTEEAASAFAKAEDWEGVARVLGHPDGTAAGLGDAWLEALPPTVVETDSLLLLARARRALTSGALAEAVAVIRTAETVAASSAVAERCRTERDRLAAWMGPDRPVGTDWLSVIRNATVGQPVEALRQAATLMGPSGRFAEGVCAFLVGDIRTSTRTLRSVAADPDADPGLAAGARLLALTTGPLCGRTPEAGTLSRLREQVEEVGIPWLDRLTQLLLASRSSHFAEVADNLSEACQREGDRWGEALVALISGFRFVWRGEAGSSYFQQARSIFSDLGAGVLDSLACGGLALSAHVAGDGDQAVRYAREARSLASVLDVPWMAGLSALILGRVHHDEAEMARARRLLEPLGTWEWHRDLSSAETVVAPTTQAQGQGPIIDSGGHSVPTLLGGSPTSVSIVLRCLGEFSLAIDGCSVDELAAKPKELSLLHLLAMHAGGPVHREEIIDALWPEAEPEAGIHRLQVAVSALRRIIVQAKGEPTLVARVGDAYRLDLPENADVDIWRIDALRRQAARARVNGQVDVEERALAEGLVSYVGPLLPADGPADWVVGPRAALEAVAVDMATHLANLRVRRHDDSGAAEAARSGLALDRYRDELWELLIAAATRSGHQAMADQARRSYAAVLVELGV